MQLLYREKLPMPRAIRSPQSIFAAVNESIYKAFRFNTSTEGRCEISVAEARCTASLASRIAPIFTESLNSICQSITIIIRSRTSWFGVSN